MSFDAHGTRRDPNNWQGSAPTPVSTTRGFTGHEHVDTFGFIHFNGRIYDPAIGRMLQADPLTGPGNQSLNRYSYVVNNPLSLTDPSGYNWWHNLDRIAGWITFGPLFPSVRNDYYSTLANPYVRMVGAAIAAYFTAGAVAGAFASELGAGAANAVGGAAGGFVGGEIQSQGNLKAGFYGAATGAFGNYLAGGTYFSNPLDSAERLGSAAINGDYLFLGNAGLHFVMNEAAQYAEARFARSIGVRPEVLDLTLMGLSVLGNDLVGSRFQPGGDKAFAATDGVGFRGYLNRTTSAYGSLGSLFFDTVDAVLAYQGLPTASFRDFAYSAYVGHAVSGHSLGTLDAIRAVNVHLSPKAVLYAVPFGNVAPTQAQVYLGNMDVVNGGYLGRLFNWNATMCATGFDHALDNYLSTCP
ncbi:MAG TPA: RHS repeat-associated core domain-containing protein [Rudaea sp.]|nr:RHS repeat-associated core domain-containing protein [Rudaea sp.]